MPFTITCPHCDANLTIPDEVAGKKIRCKSCSEVLRAEAPAPKKKATKPAPIEDDVGEEDERPTKKKRTSNNGDELNDPPQGKKKRKSPPPIVVSGAAKAMAGGAGLLLLLLGSGLAGIAGGFFGATKPTTAASTIAKDKNNSSGGALDMKMSELTVDGPAPTFVGEHIRFENPVYDAQSHVIRIKYYVTQRDTSLQNYYYIMVFKGSRAVFGTFQDHLAPSGTIEIGYQDSDPPKLQLWAGKYPSGNIVEGMAPRRLSNVVFLK